MTANVAKLGHKKVRELALSGEVVLATAEGLRQLKLQTNALQTERKRLDYEIGETVKDYPDLRENATYDVLIAKIDHSLPRQEADLRDLIQKTQLYIEKTKADVVAFGSVFNLETVDGDQSRFWLAGPIEAGAQLMQEDALAVSYLSPLGKAVWGAAVGDEIEVRLPARGKDRFTLYRVVSAKRPK